MTEIHLDLAETTVDGPGCRLWSLAGDECPELAVRRIKRLGRSPMQHLTSLRIERACHLLASTDDKVESIARQVGFDEASVFSRAFKRWVGRSPKAYRE